MPASARVDSVRRWARGRFGIVSTRNRRAGDGGNRICKAVWRWNRSGRGACGQGGAGGSETLRGEGWGWAGSYWSSVSRWEIIWHLSV